MKVFTGQISQFSRSFSTYWRGLQCTMIAFVALAYFYAREPSVFDSSVIDEITTEGHEMYVSHLVANRWTPRMLGHFELPTELMLDFGNLHASFLPSQMGLLGNENAYSDFGMVNFNEAIQIVTTHSRFVLITVNGITFSSVFDNDRSIHVFDSHARDINGNICSVEYGASTVIHFDSVAEFVDYVQSQFAPNAMFEMTPIMFERVTSHSESATISEQSSLSSDHERGIEIDAIFNSVIETCKSHSVSSAYENTARDKYERIFDSVLDSDRRTDSFSVDKPYFFEDQNNSSCHCEQSTVDQTLFETYINVLPSYICFFCNKMLYPENACSVTTETGDLQFFCAPCMRSKSDRRMFDAGPVPNILRSLNIVERRFVSKIQTFLTLIVLPGGQFAERGFAIHFPLEISEALALIPCDAQSVPVLCSVGQVEEYINIDKILEALKWLKQENWLYCDIDFVSTCNRLRCNFRSLLNSYLPNILEQGGLSVDLVRDRSSKKVCFPYCYGPPLSLHEVINNEALSFPWLFPYGVGHYGLVHQSLNLAKYYQMRFLEKDSRFRCDISYLISCTNTLELMRLKDIIGIYMNMRKRCKIGNSTVTRPTTAGDVLESLDKHDNITLSAESYMFAKNIRGTAAYWRNELWNLLAKLKLLGPPDLFLTLSADDIHWSDLLNLLEYDSRNNENMANNVNTNPVLSAMHFDRRWKAFLKYVLKGSSKCLGGVVTDYWARIEFQNRGSPHIHCFLWLDGIASISKGSLIRDIEQYLDTILTTDIPNQNLDRELYDLVTTRQIHKHTSSCSRKGKCRHDFPRKCSKATVVYTNEVGNIISRSRRHYHLKRAKGAEFVNAYNPYLLRLWKANLDLQMVGGAVGLANYVCNYVCKSEPDDLRHALSDVMSEIRMAERCTEKQKMLRIGMCLLKNRQMSAQESAFRICGFPFVFSSRTTILVNTRNPINRMGLLKSLSEISTMSLDSTDVFEHGIFDHYSRRPQSMNDVSLYDFASKFIVIRKRTKTSVALLGGFPFVRRRQHAIAVKTPFFPKTCESYWYNLLALHVPFRDEISLMKGFDTAYQAFSHWSKYIDPSTAVKSLHMDELFAAIKSVNIQEFLVQSYTQRDESHHHSVARCQSEFDDELWSNIRSIPEFLLDVPSLTHDQMFVFHYLCHEIEKTKQFLVFLTGEAGTGKSFLVKILIEYFRASQIASDGDNVLVTASTGLASINIQGVTIHSALRLPVQHGKTPQYTELTNFALNKLRQLYRNLHFLVIDEISMISDQMLLWIHRRLCTIKNCDLPFGGINVLVTGDFFQLRPVCAKFAFENEELWSLFVPLYLKENMRQSKDRVYQSILREVRIGVVSKQTNALLASRVFEHLPFEAEDAFRLYATLKQVRLVNEQCLKQLSCSVITVESIDTFTDQEISQGCIVPSDLIPVDDRDAGGFPHRFSFCVGCRVMLVKNIAVSDKLVNGVLGEIADFSCDQMTGDVSTIHVRFDNSAVGCLRKDEKKCVAITRENVEYVYRGHYMNRNQFPLVLAWAATIHKGQGLGFDKLVTSIDKEIFSAGQAYVALSRVSSLDGLFLQGFRPRKIFVDPKVLANEYLQFERFKQIKEKSNLH